MDKHKRLVLIDGSGFIYRAFYALPTLTSKYDNSPIGAVYGFCNMILPIIEANRSNFLAVIFDSARETFRHSIYPLYKSNRNVVPDELVQQFSTIRQLCDMFAIPRLEQAGVEADDIIATLAKNATSSQVDTTIISSDKDLLQLMSDNVQIFDPIKSKVISVADVQQKYGIFPEQMIDFQSLAGDSSDNILGVPSVGTKTAAKLLQTYLTLDGIYTNINSITQTKLREKLILHKDNAYLSKKLVTLKDDIELNVSINSLVLGDVDNQRILDFLEKHGFDSIIRKLPKKFKSAQIERSCQNESVVSHYQSDSSIEITKYLEKSSTSGILVIYPEFVDNQLTGFWLSTDESCDLFIPISDERSHSPQQYQLLDMGQNLPQPEQGLDIASLDKILKPFLLNDDIQKITLDIKFFIKQFGITNTSSFQDLSLMAYILRGVGTSNLQELLAEFLGENSGSKDISSAFKLYKKLTDKLTEQNLIKIYTELDLPLITVISQIEKNGILIDISRVQEEGLRLDVKARELAKEIFNFTGEEFNIASPKQVAVILEKTLGGKKIKSTSSDVLEKLAETGDALPALILNWRKVKKLKSTYADAFLQHANNNAKRIHTSFSTISTVTGRLSSKNPNLQNIPVRTQEGRFFREVVIAPKNHSILSLDYSQIELRVLAHLADIKPMKLAFSENLDIHTVTASEIFKVNQQCVTPEMRRCAKEVNFGIIYGMKAHGLSKRLNISHGEAEEYINLYFSQYGGIKDYISSVIAFANKHNFIETITKRKCYIDNISSSSINVQQFAQRQAVNATIQGSAADIIKSAMIDVSELINHSMPEIKMVLQIHDELLFEVPLETNENSLLLIKNAMENTILLTVPLKVNLGIGDNWSSAMH